MSTTGYYKRFISQESKWSDDCDTLYREVRIGDTRIGYFRTECRPGNKNGYLAFTPEMKKFFNDGTSWYDYIFDANGSGYRLSIPVPEGKMFVQRAMDIADHYPEDSLLQFWNDCLNEYTDRKERENTP